MSDTPRFAKAPANVQSRILLERVYEDGFGDLCCALDVEHEVGVHKRVVFSWDEEKQTAERSDANGHVRGKFFLAARNTAKDILRAAAEKRRSGD